MKRVSKSPESKRKRVKLNDDNSGNESKSNESEPKPKSGSNYGDLATLRKLVEDSRSKTNKFKLRSNNQKSLKTTKGNPNSRQPSSKIKAVRPKPKLKKRPKASKEKSKEAPKGTFRLKPPHCLDMPRLEKPPSTESAVSLPEMVETPVYFPEEEKKVQPTEKKQPKDGGSTVEIAPSTLPEEIKVKTEEDEDFVDMSFMVKKETTPPPGELRFAIEGHEPGAHDLLPNANAAEHIASPQPTEGLDQDDPLPSVPSKSSVEVVPSGYQTAQFRRAKERGEIIPEADDDYSEEKSEQVNDLPPESFQCPYCEWVFKKDTSLQGHIKDRHPNELDTCITVPDDPAVDYEDEPVEFPCPHCEKVSRTKKALCNHLRGCHRKWICYTCYSWFDQWQSWKQHCDDTSHPTDKSEVSQEHVVDLKHLFDGKWIDSKKEEIMIAGQLVNKNPILTVTGPTLLFMSFGGVSYTGIVAENFYCIQWNDGDIWRRSEVWIDLHHKFDGWWKTQRGNEICVNGFLVGKSPIFSVISDSCVQLSLEEKQYQGKVTAGGKMICWSDGDEWMRIDLEHLFDGKWVNQNNQVSEIFGDHINKQKMLLVVSPTSLVLTMIDGSKFDGKVVNKGEKIIWSDGDEWTRQAEKLPDEYEQTGSSQDDILDERNSWSEDDYSENPSSKYRMKPKIWSTSKRTNNKSPNVRLDRQGGYTTKRYRDKKSYSSGSRGRSYSQTHSFDDYDDPYSSQPAKRQIQTSGFKNRRNRHFDDY